MKQYNRIMLGEHAKYIDECVTGGYMGVNFLPGFDMNNSCSTEESAWRKEIMEKYLEENPTLSVGSARVAIGFLWTACFGLKIGDIILASTGNGSYRVGEICSDYYFVANSNLPHQRKVKWMNVVIPRKLMSKELQNSSGSIGTCCNISKYAKELEVLIGGGCSGKPSEQVVTAPKSRYKERDLHRLLAHCLSVQEGIITKTIYHESSKKGDQNQKWIHPDMVGVRFNEFQNSATRSLLKAADIKQYVDLYSFELKRSIMNDHQLKEYFFQALSNSSWANFGYLVAFEISEDVLEELERLNRSFGIGVIKISPYVDSTKILFPARKNEVDYHTVDKLCRINSDFHNFMERTARVLNAQTEVLEDVKGGLLRSCDKPFATEEELQSYCCEHNIPMAE